MKKKQSDQESGTACESSSKQEGKSISPADMPDKDEPATEGKRKGMPIGRPISPERYKKIKKEISDKPLPRRKGQEDPSS